MPIWAVKICSISQAQRLIVFRFCLNTCTLTTSLSHNKRKKNFLKLFDEDGVSQVGIQKLWMKIKEKKPKKLKAMAKNRDKDNARSDFSPLCLYFCFSCFFSFLFISFLFSSFLFFFFLFFFSLSFLLLLPNGD